MNKKISWALLAVATVIAVCVAAMKIYQAGSIAGARLAVQEMRTIDFDSRYLLLKHLLASAAELQQGNVSGATSKLGMLAYHEYSTLERDAHSEGLLKATGRMEQSIQRIRDLVAEHCAQNHRMFSQDPEMNLCAELDRRSNKTMEPTR